MSSRGISTNFPPSGGVSSGSLYDKAPVYSSPETRAASSPVSFKETRCKSGSLAAKYSVSAAASNAGSGVIDPFAFSVDRNFQGQLQQSQSILLEAAWVI